MIALMMMVACGTPESTEDTAAGCAAKSLTTGLTGTVECGKDAPVYTASADGCALFVTHDDCATDEVNESFFGSFDGSTPLVDVGEGWDVALTQTSAKVPLYFFCNGAKGDGCWWARLATFPGRKCVNVPDDEIATLLEEYPDAWKRWEDRRRR